MVLPVVSTPVEVLDAIRGVININTMPLMRSDVVPTALARIFDRASYYKQFRDYYDGIQPLTFETQRYRTNFAKQVAAYHENMCVTVVDSLVDRLSVENFEVEGSDQEDSGSELRRLWEENQMDIRAGEAHTEAARSGDAYVIVWPDATGLPHFYVNPASLCTVYWNDDTEEIEWGAKAWLTDTRHVRLNVYFKERLEKWQSVEPIKNNQQLKPTLPMQPLTGEPAVLANPNPSRVPMFHLGNNTGIARFGNSELKDVIPLQDALNKSVADLLVAMEFAAFKQRWATGLEMKEDIVAGKFKPTFEPGPDRLWATDSHDAAFGEFSSADLTQFIGVHDMFLMSLARVTAVPTHYMLLNPGSFPSGESLKTAEARFVGKITDRQKAFGAVWEQAMTFAAQLANISLAGRVKVVWKEAAPRSEVEVAQTSEIKKRIGVSTKQLLREMGYSESDIENMMAENDEQADKVAEREARAAASQPAVQSGQRPNNNRQGERQ